MIMRYECVSIAYGWPYMVNGGHAGCYCLALRTETHYWRRPHKSLDRFMVHRLIALVDFMAYDLFIVLLI